MYRCLTALLTPMKKDKEVDYQQLEKLVEKQLEAGVYGFVVNGTTAEAPTLTLEEKRNILLTVKKVVDQCQAIVKIIVGVSANNTDELLKEITNLDDLEFDGYMICPPYYNKTTQQGLIKHVESAIHQTEKGILLYNVPSRCGMNYEVDTVNFLAQNEQVWGIKEASGDFTYLQKLIATADPSFIIYNGNDDLILASAAVGCHGVISAIANAIIEDIVKLCNYLSNNEYQAARQLNNELNKIISQVYEVTNPIGVKALAKLNLKASDEMRLPLLQAEPSYYQKLKEGWEKR